MSSTPSSGATARRWPCQRAGTARGADEAELTSLATESVRAHAEREEQQRDRDIAEHLDADVERRPQFDLEQAHGEAGDGGGDDRHAPQVPQLGVVIEHPGAERVVQRVLDEEQHHGERRACSPKASTISGSPMLPELLNIIGGSRVFAGTFISFATGQASSRNRAR